MRQFPRELAVPMLCDLPLAHATSARHVSQETHNLRARTVVGSTSGLSNALSIAGKQNKKSVSVGYSRMERLIYKTSRSTIFQTTWRAAGGARQGRAALRTVCLGASSSLLAGGSLAMGPGLGHRGGLPLVAQSTRRAPPPRVHDRASRGAAGVGNDRQGWR